MKTVTIMNPVEQEVTACEICGRSPTVGTPFYRADLKLFVCNDCGFKENPLEEK